MPRITQYGAPKVSEQISSRPRMQSQRVAPSLDFSSVAQEARRVHDQFQIIHEQQSKAEAQDALVNFEREKNDLFFAPGTGYFNKQGRDAFDGAQSMNDALLQMKQRYSKDMSGRARDMFSRAADAHITRGKVDIMRHASSGLKAWEVATTKARVENTLENASLYWNDESRLKVQNALGRQSVIDAAKMEGITGEALNERLQNYDSSFAKGAIGAALANSSLEGEQLLEKYSSLLEPPDKVKIENALDLKRQSEKTKTDAFFSVNTASALLTKYDSKVDAIADPMMERLKQTDPKLYKSTRSEINAQFSAKDAARTSEEKDAYYEMIDMVNQGQTPGQIRQSAAWDRANAQQRNNILNGKHLVSDHVLLNELLSMPRRELAKVDPNKHVSKLNKSEFSRLSKAVKKAQEGIPETKVETTSAKINRVAQELYGNKKDWRRDGGGLKPKGEMANEFMQYMEERINEAKVVKDRDLTIKEENDLINEVTKEFYVRRSMHGIDWLAGDVELDASNTPIRDLNLLNDIAFAFDMTGPEKTRLSRAYENLVDDDEDITPENLEREFRRLSQ